MIIQNIDLNLIPDSAPVVVHCDQYDHGTGRLVIHLHNGASDYTPNGTAIIQGIKPDQRGFAYDASLSGNVVTADLTEQMTAVDGPVYCQVVVTESTGRTGTFIFMLAVQRSALPDDTDLSDSDYQLIEEGIEAAKDSEAWAVGERDGVPVPATDPTYNNNSKYWAGIASQYAQGGLIYKGSCLFANIPVTGMTVGDMWNIEDDFTTDSRFQEGAGIFVKAGTNIAWNGSKWDLLATGGSDVPIPVYYVKIDDAPTSSTPILISGLNFSKVFKLIVSTDSTTPINIGSIYLSNGTDTKRYYTYSKRTDNTGVTNVTSYMTIAYGSASYCCALEFLCQSNKENTYLAMFAGDDSVPTTLNGLSDVTITSPSNNQVLKYDSTAQKWVNGAGGGGDNIFFGTCSTAASTVDKVVVCSDFTAADLTEGTKIIVTFDNGSSVDPALFSVTLNINSTGAVQLAQSYFTKFAYYSAVLFVYHNSKWWISGMQSNAASTSLYGLVRLSNSVSGESSGSSFAATPAAVKSAYDLASGKATKVASATSGNFAGLDANGDLTDSGKKPSDFDEWTTAVTASTSGSDVVAVFDNLSDSYGYNLYAEDTLVTVKSVAKGTGTQSGIKLTYTLSGATAGTTQCYLRVLK